MDVSVRSTCLTRAIILDFAGAELAYSYQVGGERYAGYDRRALFDEQRAWNYADRWQGQQVIIRCNPRQPSVSVLGLPDQPVAFVPSLDSPTEETRVERGSVPAADRQSKPA